MILISLNLIACSSSGGGGESTPAADNGDDGNDGGGDDAPADDNGDDGNDGGGDDAPADDNDIPVDCDNCPFPKLTISGLPNDNSITFSNDDFQDTKLEITVNNSIILFSGTSLPMPACMLPADVEDNFLGLYGFSFTPPSDPVGTIRTCPDAPLLGFKLVSYNSSPSTLVSEVKFDLGNPTDPSDKAQRQALLEKLNSLDGLTLEITVFGPTSATLTFGIEQPME